MKAFTKTVGKLLERIRTKRTMSLMKRTNYVMERKKRLIERKKYVIV